MENSKESKNDLLSDNNNSYIELKEYIKQKAKEYNLKTTILSKGDNVYKDALIRVFISLTIGYFLFLYSEDNLINPRYSIGIDAVENIFNIGYSYKMITGWILFILSTIAIYIGINLFSSQAKYTKIALSINDKFKNIFNFHMSKENRTGDKTPTIAYTVLFESCRKEYLDPNELVQLLQMLHKSNSIYDFIFQNGLSEYYDFNIHKSLYLKYNNFRAKNYKPILSTILSFAEMTEGNLTEEQILFFKEELDNTKLISDDVQF